MHFILWEYQIKAENRARFEAIYSPNGAWAELFGQSPGYAGTELLQDKTNPSRYLTLDRWASKADYEAFLSEHRKEYKKLDAQCEGLTENESLLGKWDMFDE